jgi:hypothetical protein
MTGPRHVATTALALGAAILAVTVLQTEPAEARRGGAHSRAAKHHGPVHSRFVRHRLKSNKSLTSVSNPAGVGTAANTPPINPNGVQTTAGVGNLPKTAPINPNAGQTTIGGATNIPSTQPFNPSGGSTPHTHAEPVNPGSITQPSIPPGQGPSIPGQGTAGGGTSVPPVVCITQPCPPASGGHQPTSGGHNHVHRPSGVYVGRPAVGPGYVGGGAGATAYGASDAGAPVPASASATAPAPAEVSAPCLWLKAKYDATADVQWLNRYNLCRDWLLSQAK